MKTLIKISLTILLIGVLTIQIKPQANTNNNIDAVTSAGVEAQEQFKVSNILYESTDNFHIEGNDIGIEFNNGSYAIVNQETNTYIFQAVELGDYDQTFETLQQLENCIKTYASIKNNGNY